MGSDGEIRELDARTVERIAAGEVVERPASAVKELVENSLDADASRVGVRVVAGGRELIRVTDDGVGMDEASLRRAVEKHTTSKIRDIADLEGGVGTLGFRGEALHAIGAVSRLTIRSRPAEAERGTELTVEGGEVTDVSPAGCPQGTTVEVRDLFYNVPARRKYLKRDATEFAHVNTVLTNYALANPDVAVTLEHDDRETFSTTGSGDLREAVLSVYGREVARSMRPVESEELPEGPLDAVSGLVSHPETNRASREYLSTFVNDRYVTAGVVREAILDAYGAQLAPDRYPFAILFLELDPGTVDVNVHPRKLEVRFADEAAVRKQIEAAVEAALLRDGLLRSAAPRGRSKPEETAVNPERADTEPASPEASGLDTRPVGQRAGRSTETTTEEFRASTETDSSSDAPEASAEHRAVDSGTVEAVSDRTASAPHAESVDQSNQRKFSTPTVQERLGGQSPLSGTETAGSSWDEPQFDRLPPLRILGQLFETYVVAESPDGLVLVDQHAADERINYERLKNSFEGNTTTQALAQPVELELTAREADLFDAHERALSQLGFHADRVADRTVEVTTVPSLVAETAGPDLVRDVISEFVAGDAAAAETVEAAADDLLADLACYPSITGNTSLTEGSVVDLLSRLDECENPYACPHGRPVLVEFDAEEIESRFERDYPGHG